MSSNLCSKKQFSIYMIVAFGLAFILQGVGAIFANAGNNIGFSIFASLTMFAPMVGGLAAKRNLKGLGWKLDVKGKIKYYIVAWVGPAILFILGAVLFFIIFPKTFDTTGMYIKQTLQSSIGDGWEEVYDKLINAGMTPPVYFIITLIQVVTYVPIVNGCLAIGEEIGWRGYMYPYLKEHLGVTKGRIVGGIIWGVWHWPLIILAGYEYGTDYIGAPFLGPVLFCVITTVLGIFCDYLYEKTESIIVPAIAHGAINGAASLPVLFFNPEYSNLSVVGPLPVGIIAVMPMLIISVVILVKGSKSK